MEWNVKLKGSYSILFVELEEGESVVAEPGAMVTMEGDLEVKTSTGGVFKALKRALLGGEHVFMNTYTARSRSKVSFAPRLPGDIQVLDIDGSLFVQSTSYLASTASVEIDTKFGGFKSFFAGEGFFLLHLKGSGKVALSSFGGIVEFDLDYGQKMVIDTGHVVAFTGGVDYRVRTFGGLKSTLFGGEGLVVEFTGPGKVLVQTRNYPEFVEWIKGLAVRDTGSR